MGGPYHILYEIDPTRLETPGNDVIVPGVPYQSGLTPEQDHKNATLRREKNELELATGPNPHDALYEERILKLRASDTQALQRNATATSCASAPRVRDKLIESRSQRRFLAVSRPTIPTILR